jgi:hypothetical protein
MLWSKWGEELCYKSEGSGFKPPMRPLNILNSSNLSGLNGLGVYSASNNNEYQRQNFFYYLSANLQST